MIPNLREPLQQHLKPFLDWLPGEDLHLVEIGTFAGHGAAQFLAHDKIGRLTCIDTFKAGYDDADQASSADMEEVMQTWMQNISRATKPVTLCAYQTARTASLQHAVDVIYLDAKHTFEAVLYDLHVLKHHKWWGAKVVAGHDYGVSHHPGVQRAVDAVFAGRKLHHFTDTTWAIST